MRNARTIYILAEHSDKHSLHLISSVSGLVAHRNWWIKAQSRLLGTCVQDWGGERGETGHHLDVVQQDVLIPGPSERAAIVTQLEEAPFPGRRDGWLALYILMTLRMGDEWPNAE